MNRIIYLLIAGTLVAVAVAAITLGRAGARQNGEFIQVSVLAEKTANYAVDLDLPSVAPISMELVASMIQEDTNSTQSTIITIDRPPVTEPVPPSGNPDPENPGDPSGGGDGEEPDNGNGGGEDDDDRDKGKGNDKGKNHGNGGKDDH
jgi:hypothetical protein